jgi:MFS family permease
MAQRPMQRVWRHKAYAIFMVGGLPSYLTSWMQRVGVGWLTWELTHSTTWLGIVAAADLAPMIVLAAFAGAVTDRHDGLRQMRLTNYLLFMQAALLAALQALGMLDIVWLIVLSLFSGLVYPFHQTARHTVVTRTIPREDFAPAIGTDSALFQASRFVGPSIAGLLIPAYGVGSTFLCHAVGMAIFCIALLIMRLPKRETSLRARTSLLNDVIDSFRYVRQHVGIRSLFAMLAMGCVFLRPVQDMFPAFAGDVFHSDATGLAWLVSATGIGALISAAWIASRGLLTGLTNVVFAGYALFSLSTLAFVATDWLPAGVVCAALGGFALNTMSTSTQTLTQSCVANDMRGRVMGLYALIWRGSPAVGALAAGVSAEYFGIRPTFAAAALVCLATWFLAAPQRAAIRAAVEPDAT